MEPFSREQILSVAAGLETYSDHYIADQIKRHAEKNALLPATIEKVHCYQNGVSGVFKNKAVKIGSKDFMVEDSPNIPIGPAVENTSEAIQSTVYMSFGNRLCALFIFGDSLLSFRICFFLAKNTKKIIFSNN